MPKKPEEGAEEKVRGKEHCPGFLDKHGQWNTGFDCPKHLGPSGWEYCCGPENQRYCCAVKDRQPPRPAESAAESNRVPLLAGLYAAASILLLLGILSICYWCRGCPLNQRRKGRKLKEFARNSEACGSEWTAAYVNDFVQFPGHFPTANGQTTDSMEMFLPHVHQQKAPEVDPTSCHSSAVYETISEADYTMNKGAQHACDKPQSNVINVNNYVIASSTSGDQSESEDGKALLHFLGTGSRSQTREHTDRMRSHHDSKHRRDSQKSGHKAAAAPSGGLKAATAPSSGQIYKPRKEPRYVNQQQFYNMANKTDDNSAEAQIKSHYANNGEVFLPGGSSSQMVKYSIL